MVNNNQNNWNSAKTQAMTNMKKAMPNPVDKPMGSNDMMQGMTAQMDQMMTMMQDIMAKLDSMTGANVAGGGIPQ